jgi:hypothetical protein
MDLARAFLKLQKISVVRGTQRASDPTLWGAARWLGFRPPHHHRPAEGDVVSGAALSPASRAGAAHHRGRGVAFKYRRLAIHHAGRPCRWPTINF